MTRRDTSFAVAHDTSRPGDGAPGAGDGDTAVAPAGAAGRLGWAVVAGGGLLPALPLWFWWAAWEGGYPAAVFLPGLVYLVAAAGLLVVWGPAPRPGRAAAVALVALGVLTAWTWASIGWADDRGIAWLAAERTTLYFLAFALPLLWPPTPTGLVAGLWAWVGAVVVGAAAGLAGTLRAPGGFAIDGRLAAPSVYVNATAALLVMGALAALALATRRTAPAPARGLALGAAAGLTATCVLTQSRGAVAGAVAGLLLLVVLMPRRGALVLASAGVAAAVAWAADALLDVRREALAGAPVDALEAILPTLAVIAAAGAVLGTAWAAADRRLVAPPRLARTMRRGGVLLAVIATLGAAGAFVAVVGDPAGWARERWSDFRTEDYAALEASEDRFTGELGSNRYDYWRVAVRNAARDPLTGTGAAGFAAPYVQERRTDKGPLYAHSHWLQVLSDLGVPGLLALLVWLAATLAALAGVLRRATAPVRGAVAAAVVPATVVLVHGSADWIGFFPALVVPALGLAGAAAGLAAGPGRRAPLRRGRPALAVAMAAVVAAAIAALPLYLAARLTDHAVSTWPERPAGALADLERARSLNPLSPAIALNEGIIAVELGDLPRARAAFELARQRTPSAWYPHLALALLDAREGDRDDALAHLRAAQVRNPREPTIPELRRRIAAGGTPGIRKIQREILARPA